MGRWADLFVLFKLIILFILVVLVFVSHHGHVIFANLNILSRPNLIEFFSTCTKFKSGFLSMLSIEEAVDKGLQFCQQSRIASRSSRDIK